MADAPRTTKLTKRTVDAALPEAGRYMVWDQDLKGFGLRVEPSGVKTFIVRYRVGGGRRGTLRQFKVGRYGKLTPDRARDEAVNLLAQVELGNDPQAIRTSTRETLTVAELCDLYLLEGVATKKASTLALDRIRIARHIKPLIGSTRITALTTGMVERMMQDIADGKVKAEATPHTRGGRGAASRTVGLLSGIFAFALRRGLCNESPTKGVKRYRDNSRERFLSPKELGILGDALAAAEASGAHPSVLAIIRLLALTGARKNEIRCLSWSEVDLEGGRLNLADSKTGKRAIPLGAPAIAILAGLERSGSDLVFPDPRYSKEPIRGLDWAWVQLRTRAGLPDLRIHDLRHSFASTGLSSGQAIPMIGKILGHAHQSSTARYAHLAEDPVREAVDRISSAVAGALTGAQAEVVSIPGRAPRAG